MRQRGSSASGAGCRRVLLAVAAGLLSEIAGAAQETITPALQISEAYTDNVSLASPGDEEEDFITQIAPSIAYSRQAPRLEFDLNYQLEYLWYANDSDRNETFHQAEAIGEVVALPEWFFVRAGAGYSQEIVSARAPVSINNFSVTENRTDVSVLSVAPYIEHRFSDRLTMRAEHQESRVDYERSGVADSDRAYSLLRFGSDEDAKFRWRMFVSRRVFEVDDREDTILECALASIGRRFSSRLSLDLEVGREDNEYGGATDVIEDDGDFWFVRSRWAPTAHTTLDAAAGHRVFGETGSLSMTIRSTLGEFHAAYAEEFTSDIESFTMVGSDSDTDTDTDTDNETFLATSTAVDNEVYLSRRFRGRWSRSMGRSEFAVWGYRDKREYQQAHNEERIYGAGGRLGWRMTPRTTTVAEGEYQERAFREDNRVDDLWFVSLGAERRVTPRITGSLRYRYTERDSNFIAADYEQNLIILTARAEF